MALTLDTVFKDFKNPSFTGGLDTFIGSFTTSVIYCSKQYDSQPIYHPHLKRNLSCKMDLILYDEFILRALTITGLGQTLANENHHEFMNFIF